MKLLAEAGWKDRDSPGTPCQERSASDGRTHVYHKNIREVSDALPGGPAEGRDHAESATCNAGNCVQAAEWRSTVPDGLHRVGGLLFPNPETSFHSMLADQKNNNNITGFKNARVDELLQAVRCRIRYEGENPNHPRSRRTCSERSSVCPPLDRTLHASSLLE